MKARSKKRRIHPDTVVLIKQILLGLFFIVVVALLFVATWYGTRLQSVNIKTVEVSGGETISHDFVQGKVEEQLQGTYLRLIPRSFVYLYPEQDIQKALAGIERVKDITLERIGGTKLEVTFSEYVSDALWCESEEQNCLFIDNTGFAFSKAPELKGGAFLRFVSMSKSPELGQSVITSAEYKTLKETEDRLQTMGWYLERIDVDAMGDAYLMLVSGGELKISLSQTVEGTIGNLETVLASDDFTDVAPGNFRYIDLRFGNKVFVNRTEEEEVVIEEVETVATAEVGEISSSTEVETPVDSAIEEGAEEDTPIAVSTSTETE